MFPASKGGVAVNTRRQLLRSMGMKNPVLNNGKLQRVVLISQGDFISSV